MSEIEKIETPSNTNGEIITIDSAEDLISIAQRRVEIVGKLMTTALKITTHRDWVNQNGNPYLVHSGAEKVARLFGISLSNIKMERMWAEDTKGKYYIYKHTGTAALPGRFDSIEALGTCSQRDAFFGRVSGELRDTSEIDETNIMKASYSNFVVNAITHLLGLRNITWDQLNEAGIDEKSVQEIKYEKDSKKAEARLSKEALETRKKLWDMCLELAAGAEKAAAAILEKYSSFKKNGNTFKVTDIKQFKTEGWIKTTYGRVKEEYEKAFGKIEEDEGQMNIEDQQ